MDMYPVTQEKCSATFGGLIADLLGASACLDHNQIFTARGCAGIAQTIGASVTMYFTCPFANQDGSSTTCTVLLDDWID
jgi:hypothetical protein